MPEFSYPYPLRITDEEAYKTLLELAAQDDRSLNYVINLAMKEYARNHESELKDKGKKK
jgi:hypothetical protein